MKDQKDDYLKFYLSIVMNSKETASEYTENKVIPSLNNRYIKNSTCINEDGSYTAEKDNYQVSSSTINQPPYVFSTNEDIKTETKIKNISRFSQNLSKKVAKSFICAFEGCGKRFNYKWILDRHINSHFCFKLHKCDAEGCEKAYKSRENLNLHIRNKHLGEKPYQCRYCMSRFSHRNGKLIK
jgi:uncharacterized Zn-finger protein